MAGTYDKYGLDSGDLQSAKDLVHAITSLNFVLHESLFWGGEYYLAESSEYGRVAIRPNFNTFTGELGEPEFPNYRFVIAVSTPRDPDASKQRLTAGGLTFLRRTVVESGDSSRGEKP
jgi:hypothetical protein